MGERRIDVVQDNEAADRFINWVLKQLPIVIPLLGAVAYCIKLWVVGSRNTSTALEIVRNTSLTQLWSGVFITLLPTLFGLSLFAFVTLRSRPELPRRISAGLNTVFSVVVGAAIVFMPWFFAVMFLVLSVAYGIYLVVRLFRSRRRQTPAKTPPPIKEWWEHPPKDVVLYGLWTKMVADRDAYLKSTDSVEQERLLEHWTDLAKAHDERLAAVNASERRPAEYVVIAGLLATFGYQYVTLLSSATWMPAERIAADEEEYVGYVLDDGGRWTVILLDDPRQVIRVETESISGRSICSVSGSEDGRTLIELFLPDKHRAKYQKCPETKDGVVVTPDP